MSRWSIARDFWTHLRSRNKLFLIPVVIVLLIVGIALVLTAGSALAPFIYALF
jgi:hypothetical protein